MGDASMKSFGELLRSLRDAAGITQAELAERAGISEKAIGALESGRRQRPYPSTVRALADALGLTDNARSELLAAVPGRGKPATKTRVRHSIPSAPAPIIGRAQELTDILKMLDQGQTRVVTITGPGGVGKTRLAIEVAAKLTDRGTLPGVFVSLGSLSDPSLVLMTLGQALELPDSDDEPGVARLAAHLGDEPLLIVLDNFEHLLDAASDLAALVEASPSLILIVTSRAPLRIRAEREYPLRPLALPDMSVIPLMDDVAASSAVQLFLDRARAGVPNFNLTTTNYAAVAAICRRLDGLPLALELVAARLRMLSPVDLLARLEDSLPVLVGGSRDLPERQQTIEATIDWSHDLLDEPARIAFRRLAVFASGWTLEGAELVAGWGDLDAEALLEAQEHLIEQSLVITATEPDGSTRYSMLETIRQFAVARADQAGELAHLRDRHMGWCLNLAKSALQELRGAEQQSWLDRLERDHDNMRAALAWSGQKPAHKKYELQLATALWRFWEMRGYVTEGRQWLDRALSGSERLPARIRADALNAAGNLARDQGDHERAAEFHGASLELRRTSRDSPGIARSLVNLGNIMLDQGKYLQARVLYTEALERFRELGNEWDIANALNNLGIVSGYLGEHEEAASLLAEALELRQELGEAASQARTLDALGVVMRRQGDLDRAAALHEQSLGIRRELGEPRGIALALFNLGQVARYRGELERAGQLIEESLSIRQDVEDRFGIAVSLTALADVERLRGNVDRAARLYLEALDFAVPIGISESIADNLLGLATIHEEKCDYDLAAELLGASDALRISSAQPISPIDRAAYDTLTASLQRNLGDARLAQLLDAGERLEPEQVWAKIGRSAARHS